MAGEMSFWDHLEELRWCLLRVVIAFVVALVGCFVILPSIFDSVILGPAHADFFLYRWLGFVYGAAEDVDIININVTSQFMTHISVSMWMALLLVWGGKKIPELMKGLGKGVRSFKEGMNEVEKELKDVDKDIKSEE